ncbi:MAG: ATPase [Chlorobiaceae bacterium]|nr:ATPase [Chlorobiaceae bacterium]MBA4310883.1 ATPase [Chlorobiaceae bacterium]
MVLEIRLSNFFSIKEEIVLDLRAANIQSKQSKELGDNIFEYEDMKILKTVALYGANASGKSNIIKAIRFCVMMVLNSHLHNVDANFNFIPFKFDSYSEKSSKFFLRFVHKNIEYEYSFELTREEIVKETLYYFPKGRIKKIFVRDELLGSTKKDKYSFGNQINRPFDVAESTSTKTLFISRASQMDREVAKEIFTFFNEYFILGLLLPHNIKIDYFFSNFKNELLEALQIADSDIIDLTIEKDFVPVAKVDLKQGDDKKVYTSYSENIEETVTIFSFHKKDVSKKFDFFQEESAGTIKLFLALLTILDVAKQNKILLIDELEGNLHPYIVEFILKLFHKSKAAQLIYTTHNTNLLDLKKLRKDQINFCNKKEDGSTEVYSLYDYSDFRETMDVEKAYLQGRFDAVPYLNDSDDNIKRLVNG